MPIILRNFLQFDTFGCKYKEETNILKYKYRCLLRCGVEKSNNQSFISCITNIYSKLKKINITNNEFKKILIDAVSIDNFLSYNNGNLTQIFLSDKINENFIDNFIIKDYYKTSKIYNFLDKKNIYQINMFKKIIIAYEQFIKYINNNTIYIDYTYLWDVICKPNKKLFENGINLIILDITSQDKTENVKVLCPKTSYSSEFIDENKKSLILLKNDNYFEPIYAIKESLTSMFIPLVSFDYNKNKLNLIEFKKILNIIRDDINKKCIGKVNNENIILKKLSNDKVKNILLSNNYYIIYQIINYDGKIIALIIKDSKDSKETKLFYIPCYPSNYNDNTIKLNS